MGHDELQLSLWAEDLFHLGMLVTMILPQRYHCLDLVVVAHLSLADNNCWGHHHALREEQEVSWHRFGCDDAQCPFAPFQDLVDIDLRLLVVAVVEFEHNRRHVLDGPGDGDCVFFDHWHHRSVNKSEHNRAASST